MPSPRFEVPVGAIDGTNVVFVVSRTYSAGSTAVFVNGILQERSFDDGWYETDPLTGIITLKEAPQLLDTVQVFFLDQSAALPETQIFKIKGVLKTLAMTATFKPSATIKGNLSTASSLLGRVDMRKDLRGTVSTAVTIKAKIKVCA